MRISRSQNEHGDECNPNSQDHDQADLLNARKLLSSTFISFTQRILNREIQWIRLLNSQIARRFVLNHLGSVYPV